jgi:O-antigen/teichoic acid export membrane protein
VTGPFDSEGAGDPLNADELRRRASAGVFVVATRGAVIAVIGFAGTVVFARLLTPRDVGTVAIGLTLVLLVGVLSDGGLGAGLIRRPEPPSLEELRALTALQLTVAAASALAIGAVALRFGETGRVAAVMVTAAPLLALQLPGRILLERSLSYRPLALLEVSQVVAFNAWAIALVVLGFGVWGFASAVFARTIVGLAIVAYVSPVGIPRPSPSWRRARSLFAFGVRFQAVAAMWFLRDQGLMLSIVAVASVATVGLWALAKRLLEVPYLLLASLWRVSFPTMSRVVAAGTDPAPLIGRATGMAAIATGTILTALAASAPGLVPGLFGEPWREASSVLPPACLGLGIAGSVSVATQGFLYAVGDASAVLRSVVLQTTALFAVALPLLPHLGVTAVGVGLLVSFLVEAIVLVRATTARVRVDVVGQLSVPVVAGVLAGGSGWLVTHASGADLAAGLAGGACAVVGFHGALLVFRRKLVIDTLRFAVESVRAAGGGAGTGAAERGI